MAEVIVYLGNPEPVEHVGEDKTRQTLDVEGGPVVTDVHVTDDTTLGEAFVAITAPTGIWAAHADAPPTFVYCPDNPEFARLLAEHFGCEAVDAIPDGHVVSSGLEEHAGVPVPAEEGEGA